MNLSLSKTARDFVSELQAEQCKQLMVKILELQADAYPHDAKHLKGYPGYRRIDSGEFRICYFVKDEVIYISAIGKRNDDEVYKQLARAS